MKSLKDFYYLLSLDRRYTKTESEIFRTEPDNLKTVESTLSQIRRRRARGTSGLWPSSP